MLKEHIIHQSVNRPQQLYGGDRELVVAAIFLCAITWLSITTLIGFFMSLGLWFLLVACLRRMGKADPLMRQVYIRHVKYGAWYPARAGLWSQSRNLPAGWK